MGFELNVVACGYFVFSFTGNDKTPAMNKERKLQYLRECRSFAQDKTFTTSIDTFMHNNTRLIIRKSNNYD